jgi:hypothetical protein
MGNMIGFSACNKPFTPLSIPSGHAKFREGLTEMTLKNVLPHFITKNEMSQKS